jgi:hypothetical protein
MAERNVTPEANRKRMCKSSGHPSVSQLMAEQGTGPITDISVLHGNFWPEEESADEFLRTLREWRSGESHDTGE